MPDLIIICDGCSKGNPGEAGGGYIIQERGGRVMEEGYVYIGKATNNKAEYAALIAAAKAIAARYSGHSRAIFFTDSDLVVNQLMGNWKTKNRDLMKSIIAFQDALDGMPFKVQHIYRELNERADALADKAVNLRKSDYWIK